VFWIQIYFLILFSKKVSFCQISQTVEYLCNLKIFEEFGYNLLLIFLLEGGLVSTLKITVKLSKVIKDFIVE
jgi:hypothetical protein